jgi:hypothetical protein
MALPKISHPMFDVVIPSNGKKIKMRPMVVKEEKILLMAKFSEDETDIFNAIKQVVNNCIVDDVDIDKLAIFDVEYLFIKLRSFSVENSVKVHYQDLDDGEVYDFEVDLDSVEVNFPQNIENKVMITEDTGVKLKYPAARLYDNKDFMKETNLEKQMDTLVVESIDMIFDGDEVYKSTDYKKEELEEWVADLPIPVYNKIEEFLENSPSVKHTIKYTNKNGIEREIVLNKLADFFILR